MPTARPLGSFVSIGEALYFSGSAPNTATTSQLLEIFYGSDIPSTLAPTPTPTLTPTPAPTYTPCAVTAPTNGALGTCSSTLAAGSSCEPTCNAGYDTGGVRMTCSATGTTLSSTTTCGNNLWATRNSLPTSSINSGQCSAVVGSLLYVYSYSPPAQAFHKYASTSDTWTTGAQRLCRGRVWLAPEAVSAGSFCVQLRDRR